MASLHPDRSFPPGVTRPKSVPAARDPILGAPNIGTPHWAPPAGPQWQSRSSCSDGRRTGRGCRHASLESTRGAAASSLASDPAEDAPGTLLYHPRDLEAGQHSQHLAYGTLKPGCQLVRMDRVGVEEQGEISLVGRQRLRQWLHERSWNSSCSGGEDLRKVAQQIQWLQQPGSSIADQSIRSNRNVAADVAWHCHHFPSLIERRVGGNERARSCGGLHHQGNPREPADETVAPREMADSRALAGRKFAE